MARSLLPAAREPASSCRGGYRRPGHTPPHTLLSERDYEIFRRIIRGISLTLIAEERSLSIKTFSTRKSHILAKMHLNNRMVLLRYAIVHDRFSARLRHTASLTVRFPMKSRRFK